MAINKKVCSKCGRALNESEFFKLKTGLRIDLCKDCLTQYIDNRDPKTFYWILEKFDVPFKRDIWIQKTNEIYRKNPGKFGPKSVIGTYIRMMNMKQYQHLHYSDSDHLKSEEQITKETEEEEQILKERLEKGEISESEYNTLSTLGKKINQDSLEFLIPENTETGASAPTEEEKPEPFGMTYAKDDAYWANQLTQEDIDYLILKWGTMYSPQDWITMETMYNKYAEEYDLNSDREEVLKKMCKTSLKMDNALDANDVTGYKNLATVFDQLRKSGKFNIRMDCVTLFRFVNGVYNKYYKLTGKPKWEIIW